MMDIRCTNTRLTFTSILNRNEGRNSLVTKHVYTCKFKKTAKDCKWYHIKRMYLLCSYLNYLHRKIMPNKNTLLLKRPAMLCVLKAREELSERQ